MSYRYEKEISLRLIGDKVECQKYIAYARLVLGEIWVRDIELGGLDQAWRRVVMPDGTIIKVHANRWMPSVEIFAFGGRTDAQRRSLIATSLLKWLPEGIVLTPRDPDTLQAWGVPEQGYGAPVLGGPLPEVLINQAADNFYPDVLFERVRPDITREINQADVRVSFEIAPYAHLAYERKAESDAAPETPPYIRMGFTLPEIVAGAELKQAFWGDDLQVSPLLAEEGEFAHQISVGYSALFSLLETSQFDPTADDYDRWFGHRAEPLPYVDDADEAGALGVDSFLIRPTAKAVFEYTNELRVAAGRKPLIPPLRGVYNGAARAILQEIALSGSYGHDSPDFREGYRFVFERLLTYGAGSNPQYFEIPRTILPFGSENLLFDTDPQPAEGDSLGVYLAKLWESSPSHYAAMVADYFDEDSDEDTRNTAGVFQYANRDVTISSISPSADPSGFEGTLTDPVSALVATQIFQGVATAFQFGPRAWYGDGQALSFDAPPIHVPVPVLHRTDRTAIQRIARRFDAPIFAVYHRGHPIILEHPTREPRPELFTSKGDTVAATVVPEETKDGATLLAACLLEGEETLIVRAAALYAPENWATSPQVIISDYAVNEALYTDARLLSSATKTLPQETCGIVAEFSRSGGKCVVSVHTREASPNSFLRFDLADPLVAQPDFATAAFTAEAAPGAMYGTSITHMEWDGETGLWEEFAKQELMVTAVEVRALEDEAYASSPETLDEGNVYHVTCVGEYNAIAAYDGETLVYARINVDYEQKQWGGTASDDYYGDYLFRDKVKLVFSDDTEMWLRNFETQDRSSDLSGTEFAGFQLPNTDDYVTAHTTHDEKWQEVVGYDYTLMAIDPVDPAMTVRRQIEIKGCNTTERAVFGDPDPTWHSAVLNGWDSPLSYWRVRQRVVKGEDTELLPWKTYHEFSAPEHIYEDGEYTQDAQGVFVSGAVIATTHSTRSEVTVPAGYPRAGEVVFPNDPQFPRHLACLFSPKPLQVIPGRTFRNSGGTIVSQDSAMRAYGHYSFVTASVGGLASPNQHGVYPSVDRCAATHHANLSPLLASTFRPIAYTYRPGKEGEVESCYEQATGVYGGSYSLAVYIREPSDADLYPDGVIDAFEGDIYPVLQATAVRYKNEHLVAGTDYSTVNHRPFNDTEDDDSRAFYNSSLGIEGILGQDAVSRRITPVGVL